MAGNVHLQSSSKSIPQVPLRHWLFRNLKWFARNPLQFLVDNHKTYGDCFESNLSPFAPVLILTHPDYVKHVLVDNNRNYRKSLAYTFLRQSLGNGLLTNEGEFWRKQRRIAQPAFARERLAHLAEIMIQATHGLLQQWDAASHRQEPVDVAQDMMQLTSEIAAKALFSSDIRNLLAQVVEGVTIINQYVTYKVNTPFRSPLWVPTPGNMRFKKTQQALDRIIFQIIESRRKSTHRYDDLMEMLMEASDEETGERMDNRQLRDEVMTLFIAGSETSSNALAWSLYLLAQHPSVWEKMRNEILDVVGSRMPTMADLSKLSYVTQVIQESMRLYPPAWVLGRAAIAEDIIDGYRIPPNAQVYLPTYTVHRHPDWWDEPDAFKPERFSPEKAKQRHKFAYFPFGGGPRLCIGNNFALMEIMLVLTMVTQRFNLHLVPGRIVEPEPLITLRPRGGLFMRIEPRLL